ncbi:MAG: hypothetical protein LBV17_07775 [Treponema sp.]|jgi:hypothetical protein|nr:hypothetical protein [Treponema sp.]
MKYYCKNCESVFEPGFKTTLLENGTTWADKPFLFISDCPYCENNIAKIPDYETPQAYEKRTGKAYPDNGAVWIRYKGDKDWALFTCKYALKKWAHKVIIPEDDPMIVIADPPVPPPNDWEPKKNFYLGGIL